MKDVLKLIWLQASNDEARDWVETGWYLLGSFQDGVGQIPITVFRKTPDVSTSWRDKIGGINAC
jgi:hypothetical protein